MKKWPHKCSGWKPSEEDPSFCGNCGNIASGHRGPTPGAPRSFRLSVPAKPSPDDALADALAEKFIGWTVPASVCCDLCMTDSKYPHPRIGTSILTVVEARQMMLEVVIATLIEKGIRL